MTSDRKAAELAGAFVDAYRHPDAKPDPFFDPKGESLVEAFLRAAALDGRPLTDCFEWANRPHDDNAGADPGTARPAAHGRQRDGRS